MKSINDVKRKLAKARTPYPTMLMDELEDSFIENDQLRKELEEEKNKRTSSIRLLMQVTDILSMARTPDRAGAALKMIYRWLHENKPVEQEGETAHE